MYGTPAWAMDQEWVLPVDLLVIAQRGGMRADPARILASEQLIAWNAIAPDTADERWRHFEAHEMEIARWLRTRGIDVLSVREFKRRRAPDAVVLPTLVPVEFKTLHPGVGRGVARFNHKTFINRVDDLSEKCRRGLVDTRQTDATADQVVRAIAESVSAFGARMCEFAAIVGDSSGRDNAVGWRCGV